MSNYILANNPNFDAIHIFYNEFVNSISTKIKMMEIMNFQRFDSIFKTIVAYDISEPDVDFSAPHYYELYVASFLIRSTLSCLSTEQRMRTISQNECYGERL